MVVRGWQLNRKRMIASVGMTFGVAADANTIRFCMTKHHFV
jgi:hypothetical protein